MDNDCVEWQGAKTPKGYGKRWVNGKCKYAHRLAYEEAHGPIPIDKVVMHECDNPSCVNLAHLKLGSQSENIQSAQAKGRMHRPIMVGHSNPKAVLGVDQVRAIRKDSRPSTVVAAQYGVSRPVIDRLRNGLSYKEIT